jgi:hypothetical protein
MTYEKPQVTVVEAALVAIQGGKDDVTHKDSAQRRSIPAYQADE